MISYDVTQKRMGGGDEAANELPHHDEVLNVNVGVLGHVDSGKTSLVKTLSTMQRRLDASSAMNEVL